MFGFKKKSPLERTRFVEKVLEPTGGKIRMPDDWFYNERHRSNSYVWTLSLEDPSKGAYTTGVAVQVYIDLSKQKNMPAREYLATFMAHKKDTADKFLNIHPVMKQDLFTRVGFETEEGPHHILYSLFWGNDIDVAVVVVSGTTIKLWEQYAPIFDAMAEFELIDMSRFKD